MKNNDRRVTTEEQVYYYPMILDDERILESITYPVTIQWKKIHYPQLKNRQDSDQNTVLKIV